MGGSLSRAMKETMDDNMKQQQEFMLKTQKMQVRYCLNTPGITLCVWLAAVMGVAW